MDTNKYDIAIIGGGPGGYVAAIRAGQLGLKTVVIDKDNLGGVCLNWGCIPTKSLLKNAEVFDLIKNHSKDFGVSVKDPVFDFDSVIKRSRDISERIVKNVELLVKKNGVTRLKGTARIMPDKQILVTDDNNGNTYIKSDKIIIATGAHNREFPSIKVDRKSIITSKEALVLTEIPNELIVIGAGAIGVEFAYFYSVMGSKVTIIEMLDNILPIEDKEVSETLEKSFKKKGINILTKTSVKSTRVVGDKVFVDISDKSKNDKTISADKVLVAIGVEGNIGGLGLEELGIGIFKNHIKVDKTTYQTNVSNIYAIGDVIGPPWLAHVASAEAIACVEKIKGLNPPLVDYDNIPGCTYCQPQVASVGLTEAKAKELGYNYKVGKFPFMASGKAFAIGEREGFVKVIVDSEYGEILGAHIIGAEATEMIAEYTLARSLEGTAESIIKTVHAHPTLTESLMEAAAQALGEAIHI